MKSKGEKEKADEEEEEKGRGRRGGEDQYRARMCPGLGQYERLRLKAINYGSSKRVKRFGSELRNRRLNWVVCR